MKHHFMNTVPELLSFCQNYSKDGAALNELDPVPDEISFRIRLGR